MRRSLVIFLWLVSFSYFSSADEPKEKLFELRNDDRVLFLGNSFFERALEYGYIETTLALSFPDRDITFRNVGWDGDTVFGHSRTGGRRRAVFGDVGEGFQKMVEHVRLLKPSVIFLAYGANESFAGLGGVDNFKKGLQDLVEALSDSGKVRFVFFSPLPVSPKFLPDPSYLKERNTSLMAYSKVLSTVASKLRYPFVDLLGPLVNTEFTTNGLHPNGNGYRLIAEEVTDQLNLPSARIKLTSSKSSIRPKTLSSGLLVSLDFMDIWSQ